MMQKKLDSKLDNKASFVHKVFSTVSSKYDIMNDIMSCGVHRLWKKSFIDKIPDYSAKILDVAGGTGDISLRYYKKAISHGGNPDITILDINENMLRKCRNNMIDRNLIDKFNFVCADAQALPFADETFDYYTISFGIRNVTSIKKALEEAYRVLKVGGKLLCLEFSKVDNVLLNEIYKFYSFNIIPVIGEKIAGSRESYDYLVESIENFPSQKKFLEMINQANFKSTDYENLSQGIAAIHWGYK